MNQASAASAVAAAAAARSVHFEDSQTLAADDDELDSDADDLDPGTQLGQWLDQLHVLSEGLTGMQSQTTTSVISSASSSRRPVLDSYRYSEANLEGSADVDLDALIGELCALESQLNGNGDGSGGGGGLTNNSTGKTMAPQPTAGGDLAQLARLPPPKTRCRSPDTDSAYCETISVLSESTQYSCNRSGGSSVDSTRGSMTTPSPTQLMEVVQAKIRTAKEEMQRENLGEAELQVRLKNEKIKIALEKMKEASVKKLYVKVFTSDGSSKNVLIDERWTVSYVLRQLADKCQVPLSRSHAIVEYYPDLFMERVYEDHELLVENILMWTENSPNRLMFVEQPSKYDMFDRPEAYLLDHTHSDRNSVFSPEARQQLIDEFFSPSSVQPPEIAGQLFLKQDGRKSWRKFTFVLRGSGLYYVPRGRGRSSRDLVCLMNFDTVQVYRAIDWKKKYKAPTPWGFAIKHPRIQVKASKYIRYLCADDEQTCLRWMTGIRIAKNEHQLLKNWLEASASSSSSSSSCTAADLAASRELSTARCSLESLNAMSGKDSWKSTSSIGANSAAWMSCSEGNGADGLLRIRSKNAGNVDHGKRASRTLVHVQAPTVDFKDNGVVGQCCSPVSVSTTMAGSDIRSLCSSSDFSDRVDQGSLNAFEMDTCTGTVRRQTSSSSSSTSKCVGSSAVKMPLTDDTRQQQLAFSRVADRQLSLDLSISCAAAAAATDEEEADSDEELPPPPPPLCQSTVVGAGEKLPPPSLPLPSVATSGVVQSKCENGRLQSCSSSSPAVKARPGRMPPPPPPKRSENTRLSCAVQQLQGAKPSPQSAAGTSMTTNGSREAAGSFHAELQMAMQKRLRKLETATESGHG